MRAFVSLAPSRDNAVVALMEYSVVAALAATTTRAVLGAMPSQTMGGIGERLFALPLPTEPPSLELANRRVEKKDVTDVTNIFTEWTRGSV
jgi:hypothetical protein